MNASPARPVNFNGDGKTKCTGYITRTIQSAVMSEPLPPTAAARRNTRIIRSISTSSTVPPACVFPLKNCAGTAGSAFKETGMGEKLGRSGARIVLFSLPPAPLSLYVSHRSVLRCCWTRRKIFHPPSPQIRQHISAPAKQHVRGTCG